MISIPGREPTWTLSPLLLQHVLKAVPARPHICAFRACKCTISILQRNVRKSPPTAAAAIWRPTVGHARGESYVPPTTLSRLAKAVSFAVSCSEYLCPDTHVCVKRPIECPCPFVQDVKCFVPDAQEVGSGTRLCIRGGTTCTQVEKLANKFAK